MKERDKKGEREEVRRGARENYRIKNLKILQKTMNCLPYPKQKHSPVPPASHGRLAMSERQGMMSVKTGVGAQYHGGSSSRRCRCGGGVTRVKLHMRLSGHMLRRSTQVHRAR